MVVFSSHFHSLVFRGRFPSFFHRSEGWKNPGFSALTADRSPVRVKKRPICVDKGWIVLAVPSKNTSTKNTVVFFWCEFRGKFVGGMEIKEKQQIQRIIKYKSNYHFCCSSDFCTFPLLLRIFSPAWKNAKLPVLPSSSRWWFQPNWKILAKMGIFCKVRVENKKYLKPPTSLFLAG